MDHGWMLSQGAMLTQGQTLALFFLSLVVFLICGAVIVSTLWAIKKQADAEREAEEWDKLTRPSTR